MASTFRNALDLLDRIGVYDVVLPFLLVFTITFAMLEKTKIFGMDEVDGAKYTRKNLNAMAAFVIAFITVASSKIVAIILDVSSQVIVLLLLSVFFLLLIGSFMKEGEPTFLTGWLKWVFIIIMLLGILGIFLWAIPHDDEPWLKWAWNELSDNWTSEGISSIILVIVIILFMFFIVREPAKKETKKEG